MEKKATREAYGEMLVELGAKNKDIVVLDADLSGSTKTSLFAKAFPDRFFNMGIAEQNMIATAAGLATTGKIPFASSFAMFATGRAWEMIRQSVCLGEKNVKITATHGGLTVGEDGATHQALEDIAITRVIPNLSVVVPADYYETKKVIEFASEYTGPMYIRLSRSATPVVYDEQCDFKLGKAHVLKEGTDISIFACGVMVSEAMDAAEQLLEKNIHAEVVNVSSLKPFDSETVIESVTKTGSCLTVEEHNITGGLGSAVAEVLSENYPVKMKRMGVDNRFGRSGKGNELLKHYRLTSVHIRDKVLEMKKQ